MGCFPSNSGPLPSDPVEEKQAKQVEKEIQSDRQNASSTVKILFLGPGGGGKSTLFKQLRTIHGEGFSQKERMHARDGIFTFVMETMQGLVDACDVDKLSTPAQEAAAYIQGQDVQIYINDKIAKHIKMLWDEATIKEIFDLKARLNINHACAHFFDEIDRIGGQDYLPTDTDILLQRRPTTGLIEQKIEIGNKLFHMFDVGGQKNERRKWEHCFENVTAVIFVVSLSAFDEPMYEDELTNAMEDAIKLFESICGSNWFVSQNMILFLNKEDLFKEKIESGISLSVCPAFSDYDGEEKNAEAAAEYIKHKFQKQFEATNSSLRKSTVSQVQEAAARRGLFIHVTCAYKPDIVDDVFGDVQKIISSHKVAQKPPPKA